MAEADGERGAAAAAEQAGDGDDEAAQRGEQHGGLHRVLEHQTWVLSTEGVRSRRARRGSDDFFFLYGGS